MAPHGTRAAERLFRGQVQATHDLIGSWELQSYETWSADGAVQKPLGESPVGFAVFDAAGNAFIQLAMRPLERDPPYTEAVCRQLADSFGAYFGRFDIDPGNAEIAIHVQASNLVSYIGTVQRRPFVIAGDQLVLGIPGQYRATLRRASR